MNFLTKQGFILLLIFNIVFYFLSFILNFFLFFKETSKKDTELFKEITISNDLEVIFYSINLFIFNQKKL